MQEVDNLPGVARSGTLTPQSRSLTVVMTTRKPGIVFHPVLICQRKPDVKKLFVNKVCWEELAARSAKTTQSTLHFRGGNEIGSCARLTADSHHGNIDPRP